MFGKSITNFMQPNQVLRIEIDSKWRASEMGQVLISIEQIYKLLIVAYSTKDIQYLRKALIDNEPTVDIDKLKYNIDTIARSYHYGNYKSIFILDENNPDLGEVFLNLHYQYSLLFKKPTMEIIDAIYSIIDSRFRLRLVAVEYHSPGHFDFSGLEHILNYIINLYFKIANWRISKEQHGQKKEEHLLKMQEVQTINAIRKQDLVERRISNKIRNEELEQKKLETRRKKLEYTKDVMELIKEVELTAGEKRKLYNLMLGVTEPFEKQIVNKKIKDVKMISNKESKDK